MDAFLDDVGRELRRLKRLADDAIAQVDERSLFAQPDPGSNSIAVIVKHVAGNMRSRWTDFLTSDGEKPDRDRDAEFELAPGDSWPALRDAWERGWTVLGETLGALGPGDLDRTVTIRGEPHRVAQAIQRQLTHYAYHVGQIVYVARHLAGPSWRSLSIPKRGSKRFNEAPARYLDDGGGA